MKQCPEHTNSRNGGDNLSKLELVEDGGLTSSIKTYHQYTHLFLSEESAKQLGERQPHRFTPSKENTIMKTKYDHEKHS